MTTDVTNVQNAFQMILRIAVRAPLMLIFSLVMCLIINKQISLMFLGVLVLIAVIAATLGMKVMRLFREVFKRYDDLNASVQENVSAIRVVKAFVREDYEDEKFMKAAFNLYDLFVKAEKRMVIMMPGMMLAIYAVMIGIRRPLHRRRDDDHRYADLTLQLCHERHVLADDARGHPDHADHECRVGRPDHRSPGRGTGHRGPGTPAL